MPYAARLLLVTGCLAATAVALSPSASASPSAQDKSFMTTNAQTNLAELATARLALSRSKSTAVRMFATAMTKDHRQAQTELAAAARAAGFTLPTRPSTAQLAQADKLAKAPAPAFDDEYLQLQAQGHKTSIENTKKEIADGTDPDVVAYAKTYLPVAQMHLGMANRAIVGEHGAATPVRPPGASGSPSALATTTAVAHGAEKPGGNTGWLIALGVLIAIAVGAFGLWLRSAITRRQ